MLLLCPETGDKMGIQIRLEGLDEVIGKLNRMANGANSGLQRILLQAKTTKSTAIWILPSGKIA